MKKNRTGLVGDMKGLDPRLGKDHRGGTVMGERGTGDEVSDLRGRES